MTFKYENKKIKEGYEYVIGCDEVGRGCLAGPVVAAAVTLPQVESEKLKVIKSCGIGDSKLLSAEKREELDVIIKQNFLWSIGKVSSGMVDKINIHNASLLAMKRAVEGLVPLLSGVILKPSASEAEESFKQVKGILRSDVKSHGDNVPLRDVLPQDDATGRILVVVDGKFKIPNINLHQEPIIDGDNKVLSIAAASIIAKVYRDRLMKELHQQYPIYNFAQHKGYATAYHRAMVLQHGLSPVHRLSFCGNI